MINCEKLFGMLLLPGSASGPAGLVGGVSVYNNWSLGV